MTVEDLRPVFKSQGVDSAAWQELLSLQHDAQLEIRLVLDSNEAAHASPHNLRFPLSAILPDELMMQPQSASEAASLAKLADPILTWLDAQPDAATANSIEVIAHQPDFASHENWNDEAGHAETYWQWQDDCTGTRQQQEPQQQSSWQLPADFDCPSYPQHADGLEASQAQHHPSSCHPDPEESASHITSNAGSYLSTDISMPLESVQQLQVAAPLSSNCGTTAAASAAADECWHPDMDLAALQRKLQHVQSGARLLDYMSHVLTLWPLVLASRPPNS